MSEFNVFSPFNSKSSWQAAGKACELIVVTLSPSIPSPSLPSSPSKCISIMKSMMLFTNSASFFSFLWTTKKVCEQNGNEDWSLLQNIDDKVGGGSVPLAFKSLRRS